MRNEIRKVCSNLDRFYLEDSWSYFLKGNFVNFAFLSVFEVNYWIQIHCCKAINLTNSVAQEPEGSSPHSQQPAIGPCPETVESNPHPSSQSILIQSSHLRLGLPSGLFHSGFPTTPLYTFLNSPMRAPCPAHLLRLDLTCLMISGDEYKL
jgi:hypothetical protein